MEGFWKALLDKISIEIFFMTILLFGLSLCGLFFFANQISFLFLIPYCCLSISISYFMSRGLFFLINNIKERSNAEELSNKFKNLSELEKEALLSILISGDVGNLLDSTHDKCEKNLVIHQFIIAKSKTSWGDYYYIVNPKYRNNLSSLLNKINKA